jgi:hypothetical protein
MEAQTAVPLPAACGTIMRNSAQADAVMVIASAQPAMELLNHFVSPLVDD